MDNRTRCRVVGSRVVDKMIRPYADSDLPELLDVWHRASRQAHPFLTDEFLAEERRRIAEEWLPISQTFVCEVDGRVAGFLSLVGEEIGGLFVAPESQRLGYGRELVAAALAVTDTPELSVFEANTGARRFYEKCGFAAIDRRVNDDTGFPEVRMRLSASQG